MTHRTRATPGIRAGPVASSEAPRLHANGGTSATATAHVSGAGNSAFEFVPSLGAMDADRWSSLTS